MENDIPRQLNKIKKNLITIVDRKGKKKKLKILFVASEAAPFAKAGGLGDIMFSLPMALNKLGQDARILIPRYGGINLEKYKLKMKIKGLKVPTDQPAPTPRYLTCNLKEYNSKKTPRAYFLENMEYYEKRANIYGYSDDFIRWALLCRGTIEFIKRSSWKPDIIVASDWQTALIPNYIQTKYKKDQSLQKIPTILAIHNLKYQGMQDFRFAQETKHDSGTEEIPDFFNPRLGKLNWLLRGIIYSDAIVTVSPTYAKEILTPEYGEGLDKVLNENQEKISGILNGISLEKFNPQTDPLVPFHYNVNNLKNKQKNRLALQDKFGLEQNSDAFLVGIVSRLTEQKGFDLTQEIIDSVLENIAIQFVVVGDGEARYKARIQKTKEKFPKRIGHHLEFNSSLAHLVFAGVDALLMPSKFEPCGVTQMQAMRYGAIPIVRKTGGLADTVINFNPRNGTGNGFVFQKYDPLSLLIAIIKAQNSFNFKRSWARLMKKAMKEDFSWANSARAYLNLFYKTLEKKDKIEKYK